MRWYDRELIVQRVVHGRRPLVGNSSPLPSPGTCHRSRPFSSGCATICASTTTNRCTAPSPRARLSCGGELIVRVGTPESVLPALARDLGATRVLHHEEAASEETTTETDVAAALVEVGAALEGFWGHTLAILSSVTQKFARRSLQSFASPRLRSIRVRCPHCFHSA